MPETTSASDEPVVRLAMWSGPRNISTAMMRAWGSRPDTAVVDEPLYAHYLQATGLDHPGRDAILAHHESDWRAVADRLTGPVPGGRRIFYQKHMAHHLLDHVVGDWLWALRHAFLIREPGAMLRSLAKVWPEPTLADTGLPQQTRLFEAVAERTGTAPPVLSARDVLTDPRGHLAALCDAVGVPFDEAMLSWPLGRRPTDGVWAEHWYGTVEASTGFAPYEPRDEPLPDALRPLYDACLPHYERLHRHRLQANPKSKRPGEEILNSKPE